MNYSHSKFVDLCILAGCDYNENMKRVAILTAYKYLNVYHNIDAFPNDKFDKKCLKHHRCREMFSPVKVEDIWEEGFLNYQAENIMNLNPCLESLDIFNQHYYIATLLQNLQEPVNGKSVSPPPIPEPEPEPKPAPKPKILLNIIPN